MNVYVLIEVGGEYDESYEYVIGVYESAEDCVKKVLQREDLSETTMGAIEFNEEDFTVGIFEDRHGVDYWYNIREFEFGK